ncbi:MAG: hypothetical protein NUV84_00320 [Candidatus Uhrbacteria bacterium]|nr:hypothetical protein [Candidatus Uhrbacteria bacterium]
MVMLKKYQSISFQPPPEVALEAVEGLALRREFGRGGTRVGIARARDLKNRRNLSPSTIKRMVSYFARHEVDKQGKDWNSSHKPSNGRIAWLLWGGDSGRSWATKINEQMKRADKRLTR